MYATGHVPVSAGPIQVLSGVFAALLLWLIRPFSLLGGTLLQSSCSAQGRHQALAIGIAQLIASTLTGLGLTAYVCMLQWTQGADPPWSWSLAAYLVAGVLFFDASLNVALNYLTGWRHVLLKALRVGMTAVLSLQASHMLLLLAQAPSLAEPARVVAQARFDASLIDLRNQSNQAAQTSAAANQALAEHVSKAISPTAEPPACADSRKSVALDDKFGQRQQRHAQTQCNTLTAQATQAYAAQQAAYEQTRQMLAKTAKAHHDTATAADKALANRERQRNTTVAQLSQTPAVRQAAFEQLQTQDTSLRVQFWLTSGLLLTVELLAILMKTLLRSRDEAVLRDKLALQEQVTPLAAQVVAQESLAAATAGLSSDPTLLKNAHEYARRNHEALAEEAATKRFTQAEYDFMLKKVMQGATIGAHATDATAKAG